MAQPPRENWKEPESELFRLLVENVKDYAIFVIDPEGRVQSWNQGAERMLGYREEEIIGRSADVFFTPEDVEAGIPRQEMQQALAQGRGDDDRWHVRKGGSLFWAGGTMTPLWDDDNRLRGFAKIMRDRTEWKRSEDERANQWKESERQKRLYEAALSNTPDLVYVFDLDHRFAYVNEGLLAMWGRTWDEAIGKNCLELGYEPWHAAMHDREIDQVAATKQPVKGEVPFTGTLGRRIYEYILVPVMGENGEVEAVAGTTRDVTDRRQVEEQVRHNEERFRSLMEQAPFSIQVFSPDGRTIRVNRAWEELWGIRSEQAEGYNVLEDPQLEARGILPYIQQGFAGQTARIPAIQYNPNDTIPGVTQEEDPRRWLSAVIYPIKDADGRVREVVLIHEDITARHLAEERLREADRRKDEFLAILAHELRNPLAPIRTGLEVMKLAKNDPATLEEIRHTMERQTQQLISLVDDLLDVSRITRGKLELRKCRIKLSEIVQSAMEASEPFISEARHELAIAIPKHPIDLDADPHRLAQVLVNLLNNASKYTPEGGRIELSAQQQDGEVVISVKDNGIGIPADMQGHIFEMFAQINRPVEQGYTGLGIGLTLVKSLVEMHGGQIEVQSGSPDRGSVFKIRLPILSEMPVEKRPPAPGRETAAEKSKRRVLVVDDNTAAAKMLSMVVKMLGNEVRTAGDGQQGIEVAAEFLPDVILMDIGMPRMNGYEAARHIRQQAWGKKIMLVALTGWGQDEDKRRTKEAGFDYHLTKPAEPSELQRLLAEADRKLMQ